jgi:hypothetical protein
MRVSIVAETPRVPEPSAESRELREAAVEAKANAIRHLLRVTKQQKAAQAILRRNNIAGSIINGRRQAS